MIALTPAQHGALSMLVTTLDAHTIPYQITGGLAGNFHGSLWPLHDLDLEVDAPLATVAAFHRRYLSRQHLEHPERGCPIAAVGAEVSRCSKPVQQAFGTAISRLFDTLASGHRGSAETRRAHAFRDLGLSAGATHAAR